MGRYALIGCCNPVIVSVLVLNAENDQEATGLALTLAEGSEGLELADIVVWDLDQDVRVCTVQI